MPYEWVDNEVALEHNGVKVYHVYKGDYMSDGPMSYHYSLEAGGSFDTSFDVDEVNRVLNNPVNTDEPTTDVDFATSVLKAAIEQGLLTDGMEDHDVWGKVQEKKA